MNLADCISAEWAQDGYPQRHRLAAPSSTPFLRIVTRDSNGVTVVQQRRPGATTLVDIDREPLIRHEPKPMPRPIAPALALPAVRARPGRGGAPRSNANPWPRGKQGLIFNVLKCIGGSRQPRLLLGEVVARLGGNIDPVRVSYAFRELTALTWLERKGSVHWYTFAITETGRKALEA